MPRRIEVHKVLALVFCVTILVIFWLTRSRQPITKITQRNPKIGTTDLNKIKEYLEKNADPKHNKLKNIAKGSIISKEIPTVTKYKEGDWSRSESKDPNNNNKFQDEIIIHSHGGSYTHGIKNTFNHANLISTVEEKPLTTNQENWYTEQELRKFAIQEACRGIPRDLSFKHLMEDPKDKLGHLLIDDQRKVIYCYIPKVACTNWKRLWLILNGLSNTTDPLQIPMYLPHAMHGYMMLTNQRLGTKSLEHKLQTYTKFIFARHPFERLLSAFRDKLENLGQHERKPYWKLAASIMRKVRKNSHEVNSDGLGLRFEEFVRFALEYPDWFKDDHFTQYEKLCHPCAISYDFIGKYETLLEDAEKILRAIGAPSEMHFPPFAPWTNTSHVISKYYGTLSEEQIIALYKIYQRDFQLFQYY